MPQSYEIIEKRRWSTRVGDLRGKSLSTEEKSQLFENVIDVVKYLLLVSTKLGTSKNGKRYYC